MVKTIIFDLGGIFIDVIPERTLQKITKKIKIIPEDILTNYLYHSSLVHDYERGFLDDFDFVKGIQDQLEINVSYNFFKRIWNGILVPVRPMIDILPRLEEKYHLVLLSNTNKMHMDYCLKKYSFFTYFQEIIFSYQVGFLKPEQEIFHIAKERSNSKSEECLFIDDRIENVKAARKFGFHAIHFSEYHLFIQDIKKYKILI